MENAIIKTEYGTAEAENGTIIYTPEEIQRIEDFKEAAGHIFSENMIQDMAEMGFFHYPASLGKRYHGNYIGGLYDHSMAVYRALQYFTGNIGLIWERPESPLLVAIFHDWVKLQDYSRCENSSPWIYEKKCKQVILWPRRGKHYIGSAVFTVSSPGPTTHPGRNSLHPLPYGSVRGS